MDKEGLLRQLREDVFTRLAPSKIHGIGVFAIKQIPKGTNPFRGDGITYGSIPLSKKELREVPRAVRKLVHDMCAIEDGYHWVPDTGIEKITKSWYLNHSTHPNVRVVSGGEFVTTRTINIGEELTADYRTYSEEVRI